MNILKGQHLHINHIRKGEFDAVATRDFNTDAEEFYPVAVAKGYFIQGLAIATYWSPGDEIPCRKSLCTLTIIEAETA